MKRWLTTNRLPSYMAIRTIFRVDKPMVIADKSGGGRGRVVKHFTRAELFGYPEAHWVRATIDPDSPNVFSFTPEMVRENYADRWK